jgi:DNA primase large subunit
MTPKEKAEELFDKFELSFAGVISADEDWEALGKQCALIAVDEVIEALHEHHWQNRLIIDYWQEVKNELEKL